MVEAGVDTVLELGPGAALATMVRTSYPALRVRAFDDFRSLDGVRDWLG
jgi:[acyl-carrier-protein] S-malonyltransferase